MSLALKLALAPVLWAQAVATRRAAPTLPEAAGARTGALGRGRSGALRLLIAGDSSAAGVGVATQDRALAGHLVHTLHRATRRPVHWALHARSGFTTRQVLELLQGERRLRADAAVVVTGVNDVIGLVPVRRAIAHRAALTDWLLAHTGVRHVVFAALPPVHRFPLLPQPLRAVMGADARAHDAALARWAATRRDVSHVPIAFELTPESMARDGFHPGEPVYRACGEAIGLHLAGLLASASAATPTTPTETTP